MTPASHFVCLSDLHLGYDESFLTDPSSHPRVAAEVAEVAGGSTQLLVLNGDCLEACVPARAGEHDASGFPAATAEASRSFFDVLLGRLTVEELVIVWGNHDFCLWERLATACAAPVYTNDRVGDVCLLNRGHVLRGAEAFLSDVLGLKASGLPRVTSAYPNYVLGRHWPFTVFHHGHLLDRLVLGWEDAVDYVALKLLVGQGSPGVSRDGGDSVAEIVRKTSPFVSALWRYNSHARADEWQLLRRFTDREVCHYYPDREGEVSEVLGFEVQGRGLGDQVGWYLRTLEADPTTPSVVGPGDDPAYLFIGHDHGGGQENVTDAGGHEWRLVNTGGWVRDRGEKAPHSHASVWRTGAASPVNYCLRT